jgi:hypothetical protein
VPKLLTFLSVPYQEDIMEYVIKYQTVLFNVVRTFTKTSDRNTAISEMRDLVFFHDAQTAWIEVDGKIIDQFTYTPEVRDAIKAVDAL